MPWCHQNKYGFEKIGRRGAPERFLAVAFGMGKVC
jgi:hypothetical protein